MIDGGIRMGVITELCGNPGSGKSNLWFDIVDSRFVRNELFASYIRSSTQLCVSAQIEYGVSTGQTGTVVYIDTEGSFVPIRLHHMATAADNHYRNHTRISMDTSSIEQILKNVTYFRCVNIAELLACLIQLKHVMQVETNIKLIILDSLAHPIRSLIDGDHLVRHKYTVRIVAMLQKLASDYNCAVSIKACIQHVHRFDD
jgi:RAD51-like protein 2